MTSLLGFERKLQAFLACPGRDHKLHVAMSPVSHTPQVASELLSVTVDRDSVCAGDDCVSHAARFDIPGSASVLELLSAAWRASPLAGITGGRATWLIDAGGHGTHCIGVMAEQWPAPKLTIPTTTTAEELFAGQPRALHFRYWCQSDPAAVFEALATGRELPPRF